MNPEDLQPIDLPSGFTLLPMQDKAIDHVLTDLLEKSPAKLILLTEVSGQVLSMQGERGTTDLVALSALIAGDLAASHEIARLTNQYQDSQLILREGPEMNMFICGAGTHMVLFVQVGREVPLGWARLLIREASHQLANIVTTNPQDLKDLEIGLSEEKLSTLVENSLGSIWGN